MPVLQGEAIYELEMIPEPMPDLMAEYYEVEISLYGVTGTPEELIKMCPVPHENMTLEAKNMFLVMAINESGVEISEKHLPYFLKVTEARGVELKVTVREDAIVAAQPEATPRSIRSNSSELSLKSNKAAENPDPNIEEMHVKIQKKPDDTVISPIKSDTKKYQSEVADEPSYDIPDASTTNQMDEWLAQVRYEYETRQANSVSRPDNQPDKILKYNTDPIIDVKVLEEEKKVVLRESPDPLGLAASQQEDIADVYQSDATVVTVNEEKQQQLVPELTEGSYTDNTNEEFFDKDIIYPESLLPVEPVEVTGEYWEAQAQGQTLESEVDETLISGLVNHKINNEFLSLSEIFTLPTFDRLNTEDQETTIIDQLRKYVSFGEDIEEDIEEAGIEANALICEVENITERLIKIYLEYVPAMAEEATKIELQLESACVILLHHLGAEYDNDILRKFTRTLLEQKIVEYGFIKSTDLLLDKGTQERKQRKLTDIRLYIQSKLPSFRLIGRYAIWCNGQALNN